MTILLLKVLIVVANPSRVHSRTQLSGDVHYGKDFIPAHNHSWNSSTHSPTSNPVQLNVWNLHRTLTTYIPLVPAK